MLLAILVMEMGSWYLMKARDERVPNTAMCEYLLDAVLLQFDDPRLLEITASHFASPHVSVDKFITGLRSIYGDDVANFFVGLSGGGEFPFSNRLQVYRDIARGSGYPQLQVIINDKSEYTFIKA